MSPLAEKRALPERTPQDFAIEFGRYMAADATAYLQFMDRCKLAPGFRQAFSDQSAGLKSAIYEFEDRAPIVNQDTAIALARDVAETAKAHLTFVSRRFVARIGDDMDAMTDHYLGLKSAIYEFEKRAARAGAMPAPVRLQLSRTSGFKLQNSSRALNGLPAVNCARPHEHKNPYVVGPLVACGHRSAGECGCNTFRRETAAEAVEAFEAIPRSESALARIRDDLAGKNLACWCGFCDRHCANGKPLAEACADCPPCHCDVLGKIANP